MFLVLILVSSKVSNFYNEAHKDLKVNHLDLMVNHCVILVTLLDIQDQLQKCILLNYC